MGQYVLIVDDDADFRSMLQDMIEKAGLNARSAAGGEEALQIVAEAPPSFIFLDLLMPGVDGFEVLERLRAIPETRDIPIFVMTNFPMQGRITLSDVPGIEQVVQKTNLVVSDIRAILSSMTIT